MPCFWFRYIHFILYVWTFYLHLCIFTTCVLGTSVGQERVSDPLELHLQFWSTIWVLDTAPWSSIRAELLRQLSCSQSVAFVWQCINMAWKSEAWVLSPHHYQSAYVYLLVGLYIYIHVSCVPVYMCTYICLCVAWMCWHTPGWSLPPSE